MSPHLGLVEVATATDAGRVRQHNEDRLMAAPPLVAVADGMGGASAGEVAATVAVERLLEFEGQASPDTLREAVIQANDLIRDMAAQNPEQSGMGTTLTAALVEDGHVALVHVGDSRAYLLRDGSLRRLTDDHSLVGELVRRGEISEEEADRHPHRNVITRALGAEPTVQPDEVRVELAAGDILLLCTDGLSGYVGEDAVREALVADATLQEIADALVEQANAAGGADNTTVVLARIGPRPDGAGDESPEEGEAGPAPAAQTPGHTAEMPVVSAPSATRIRTVRVPDSPRPAPPARVLERSEARRSRKAPVLVAIVVALLLLAGGVTWVGSRTYFVEPGPDGDVRVAHGFPWSPLGLDLFEPWQETGLPADSVPAEARTLIDRSAAGRGEAVESAAELVWRFGVGRVTALLPPPPPPPPRPPAAGPQ